MNIYHLKREYADLDETQEMVVIAGSEEEARQLASERAGDEGAELWLGKVPTCELLGVSITDTAEVVCRCFHSA